MWRESLICCVGMKSEEQTNKEFKEFKNLHPDIPVPRAVWEVTAKYVDIIPPLSDYNQI